MQLAALTVHSNRRADLTVQASSQAAELQRQQLESALAATNNTQLHLMRVLTAQPSARAQLSMHVLARRLSIVLTAYWRAQATATSLAGALRALTVFVDFLLHECSARSQACCRPTTQGAPSAAWSGESKGLGPVLERLSLGLSQGALQSFGISILPM